MADEHFLAGDGKLHRNDLATYLNRLGRGINCRLDIPILTIADIKTAATQFSELSKELAHLAFDDDRVEIYRILEARHAMEAARSKIARKNHQKISIDLAKQAERRAKP